LRADALVVAERADGCAPTRWWWPNGRRLRADALVAGRTGTTWHWQTRPVRRLLVTLAALLSVAVGCGGEPEAQPTASPTPTSAGPTTTPTPTPEPIWPLTGLPAPEGPAERPVLVVKVDNTASARPQAGLSAADIVVEELVEGGLTRLAVLYHSTLPDAVAPVRSIRTSDIGIVLPTGGALVASGGAQRVLRAMDEAGVTVVTEGSAGFPATAGGRRCTASRSSWRSC
jgi:hypothetical protein